MRTVHLGAVHYLNARPLVYGLELRSGEFVLRFDPPSKCAALLHEGSVDVGMIPTIEYLRGHEPYRIVPGLGIISEGAVASVALFSSVPIERIGSIAADTSSRTSNALLRILCHETLGLQPEFVPMAPDPTAMLTRCDAALIIGDAALFLPHQSQGLLKIDLGEEWTALTGLPFVWAFWAGRPGVLTAGHVTTLQEACRAGVAASDEIADAYCGPERAQLGRSYLRENIRYDLGEREAEGLRAYFHLAEKHRVVESLRSLAWY
jgi:chorismate dehydratase